MKWRGNRQSTNVEDRRSEAGIGRTGSFAAFIPIFRLLIKSTPGRIILVIGVAAYFLGYNPLSLLDSNTPSSVGLINDRQDDDNATFVATVLAETEDVWHKIFQDHGARYTEPGLVLFRDTVRSGCGFARKQTGPFYCPTDQKVYLDLSFFEELKRRHNAPGDFAQAYVIAHEIGHHVQYLSGTLQKVAQAKQRMSQAETNALQVQVELQADCYAGVWAHYIHKEKGLLEEGDIQEALNAAQAIGDDTLQKKAQGYVVPDSFTHGSARQRMEWFKKGFTYGTLESCGR